MLGKGSILNRRKLVALVFADIVGFSTLVGEDDAAALKALSHLKKRVLPAAISKHHGKIVDVAGDGFFLAFDSVVEATRFSIAFHRKVKGGPLTFRVGIHIGDKVIA